VRVFIGISGIDEVVNKANRAFQDWAKVPLTQRLKYLQNLSKIIINQFDEIARLISVEQGKTITDAKLAEIIPVLEIIKDMRRKARKVLNPKRIPNELILFSNRKSQYHFVPYGVVAVISPWNFPFSVPIPEIITAIIAGNTVIFKPAPATVLIGQKIDELFKEAAFPEGVVNTIFIKDKDAPYLVGHSGVEKIVFTGSTRTGKQVMCTAAEQLSPVVLELGGKDAAVVAADADVERAARGIVWGAFFSAGQICASIERVYVERPVAEKFIDACIREVKQLKIGDPLDENTDIGPLENKRQLEIVMDHIQDAVKKGAKVVHGGKPLKNKGFFHEPTILVNVDHTMKIMTEETFGPILPIMVVDSLDEGIQLANDSDYGLSAYGWTLSKKNATKMQQELSAGIVMINDATSAWGEPNAPWGGFRKSGIGRTRCHIGLLEMVQVKYVSYDRGKNKINPWWFPYDQDSIKFADQAVQLLFSDRLIAKVKSLFRLIKINKFVKNVSWMSMIKNFWKLF